MKRRFSVRIIVTVAVLGGALLTGVFSTYSFAAGARDCNTNSIINCGALTAGELTQKYTQNQTGDLKTIYDSYGISSSMIASGGQMGEVRKDGTVVVGGQVVATNAMSIGRHNMAGSVPVSIGGGTYYNSPPSTSFLSQSISAFVFLDGNGRFISAILTSCGNPVNATPVVKTPPPTPPAPSYKCDSLTKDKISRNEYNFTATAQAANGATIVNYTYDFGDSTTETSPSNTIKHTYRAPGDYLAQVTVNVQVNGQIIPVTSPHCQTTVTISQQPVARCDALTAQLINVTDRTYAYTLSFTAEGGAALKTVDFDFGDDLSRQGVTPDELKNVTHTYAKAGTYTTTATLHFVLDMNTGTITDDTCVTTITVAATPPPTPPELPKTGPLDMATMGMGIGSLVGAGWSWQLSRRQLLAALLNRQ